MFEVLNLSCRPEKIKRGGFGTGTGIELKEVYDFVILSVTDFKNALPKTAKLKKIDDYNYNVIFNCGKIEKVTKNKTSFSGLHLWRLLD